ncbi:maleylpyruvate isomerase family mycothiol-dependent enzyme [Paenarthrobacter sp. Z7-10]|uniref:maleylpyruvate isomerase family mycothiol-dependent enzyme n=1 Tax=Paenarthrobacter sp. Z7-10 TaxID=2787635 RepID=UPI0022A98502|nr:maleylpyruvate isomerase family mycothiol-dependent enzyme [Paenarthrobacter sp. Z7-10]MCZ2402714.1 maleylpyruvate isomerase family mycothiol-dependent enzyme [Paenarthrobacter sp. Z7-10]
MERLDYLAALSRSMVELRRIAEQSTPAQLETPVRGCPGWTVADVFGHLGSIERWTAGILAGGKPEASQPWPAGNPVPWFLAGTADFLAGMESVDPNAACWTMGPPRTATFWLRRQAHEHTVHLWDVMHALASAGSDTAPVATADPRVLPEALLPSELAVDGVDEVFSVFVPRQVKRGLMPVPAAAVAFAAAPAGRAAKNSWILGEGTPAATVTADARTLYLALWGRVEWQGHALLQGDTAAARTILSGPLVP